MRLRSLRQPSRSVPRRRSTRDEDSRQQMLATVGFVAIIVIAALILVGTVAAGYYNSHLAAVASVNGTSISKDQWAARVNVDLFQINQAEARIREAVAAGTIDSVTANDQVNTYEQQKQSVATLALEGLIDQVYMQQLAAPMGITVSQADVDAAFTRAGETPETRHVLAIFVAPQTSAGADLPTAVQIATAKANADKALAALKAGQAFAAVAKQYSTDPSKGNGGDYGDVTPGYPADPAWVKALFQVPLNGLTPIVQGADGIYRIGKVTKITPAVPDPTFAADVQQAVGLDAYRYALQAQVLQQKLQDRIVAEALKQPALQVHAYQIFVQLPSSSSNPSGVGGEVRVSHILFSPNHNPQNASKVALSDPAWAKAKAAADAAAAQLRAISNLSAREAEFAKLAKTESDDTGSGAQGGDLGWATPEAYVSQFSNAIFQGQHKIGDIIGPVQTQYGWHVILYMGSRPDPKTFASQLLLEARAPGADFQALAKANSDGPEAAQGGDLGWIARGQETDYHVERALFALSAGQVSSSVLTLSDGFHIYKVTERIARALSASQVSQIQSNAFTDWYQPQKDALNAAGKIYRDPAILASAASPTP